MLTLKNRAKHLGEAQFLSEIKWEVDQCSDLTKAVRLEKELRELSECKEDFTPEFLHKILGYATIMQWEVNTVLHDLIYDKNPL
jgi:hypothetical protein